MVSPHGASVIPRPPQWADAVQKLAEKGMRGNLEDLGNGAGRDSAMRSPGCAEAHPGTDLVAPMDPGFASLNTGLHPQRRDTHLIS